MVVVKVTATDKTPEDTYQVLVKDGAGTVKQFFVKKVPKQPTGNVSQVAQSKKKAQGHK
jgi:hypothetical protein